MNNVVLGRIQSFTAENKSLLLPFGIILTCSLLFLAKVTEWDTFSIPNFVEESPHKNVETIEHQITNVNDKKYVHKQLPGIIGIGCKKCGTGAFRQFIKYNSRIKTTNQAETFFFDDLYKKGTDYYKSLLPDVFANEIAYEKTANYFTNKDVPRRIIDTYAKEMKQTPQFVLIVCDPVQRAFSDFMQAKSHREDLKKLNLVQDFETFDEYVDYALRKTGVPAADTLDDFYLRIPELLQDQKLIFLLRGVYSYYLQHWLKTFQMKDFVCVNGDRLLTDPGRVMVTAQKQLGLDVEVGPKDFVYVPDKGFYCVRTQSMKKTFCLGHAKGNTRKVKQGVTMQIGLSANCTKQLHKFYKPFMKHFAALTGSDKFLFSPQH